MEENIRLRTERAEHLLLASDAAFSDLSMGRIRAEQEDDLRTCYQRDRDRILHCKSFRRLKHKTQVFLSPMGDHYRTRLTHTLEVAQIARTIARGLRLNEDLVEAIALGHDLGHTPFGHAGERVLNQKLDGKFKHYLQSVRVAALLEKDGKGLNLCRETLNGMACHTKGKEAYTIEGRIIRWADKIAFINHDIEDAQAAGILSESELPFDAVAELGRGKSARITTLVKDMIENKGDFSPKIYTAFQELIAFMYREVYIDSLAKAEEKKAEALISTLYDYYFEHIDELPPFYISLIDKWGKERAVADYIYSMTDGFATRLYQELFLPKAWMM